MLKRKVQAQHSRWCIHNYVNLQPGDKFPRPKRDDIIKWGKNAMSEISGDVYRKTFLSIGYYHPEDDNLDLEGELVGFQLDEASSNNYIEYNGLDLVIPDVVIARNPNFESILAAQNEESDIGDQDDVDNNDEEDAMIDAAVEFAGKVKIPNSTKNVDNLVNSASTDDELEDEYAYFKEKKKSDISSYLNNLSNDAN
jgi:hypothetical protein